MELDLISDKFDPKDSKAWENNVFTELQKSIRGHLKRINDTTCYYCKTKLYPGTHTLQIEHIIDKSHYPEFTFEKYNLTIACPICNTMKGVKHVLRQPRGATFQAFPNSSTDYSIVHAYYDTYEQHIEIEDDILHVGLTSKGRKTIHVCKLYRSILAEQKAQDTHLQTCSEHTGLAQRLRATFDPTEKTQIVEQIDNILNRVDEIAHIRKFITLVNETEQVRITLDKIEERNELYEMLISIEEINLDLFILFINTRQTFEALMQIISDKLIRKELDNIILTIQQSNHVNQKLRVKLLITLLLADPPLNQHINLLVSNRLGFNIDQLRQDVDFFKDVIDEVIKIIQVMSLISKINRYSSVKNSIVQISPTKVVQITDAIRELTIVNVNPKEKNLVKFLKRVFKVKAIIEMIPSQELISYKPLFEKLI
ncbi:HNH endonuclease [Paenibacillus sp. MCAF9]